MKGGDVLLQRELRLYSLHLLGMDAPPAAHAEWRRFHAGGGAARVRAENALDRALLALARSGPASLAVADAFAGRFARRSALRRRLVLALALLECAPDSAERLDRPRSRSRAGAWAAAMLTASGEALALCAAVFVVPVAWLFASILPAPLKDTPE